MNNIQLEIDELFNEMEESKLYKNYVKVKVQLENDSEVMKLISDIKRYQKIVTNNKDKFIENKLKELYNKLNSYPVYQSYLIIKEELEEELFMLKETFEKYFNDVLKIQ